MAEGAQGRGVGGRWILVTVLVVAYTRALGEGRALELALNVPALPDADALRALARTMSLAELGVRLGRSPGAVAALLREAVSSTDGGALALSWQEPTQADPPATPPIDQAPPVRAPAPRPERAPPPSTPRPASGEDVDSAWAVEVRVGGQVVRRVVVAATLRQAVDAVTARGFDEVVSVSHVGRMLGAASG